MIIFIYLFLQITDTIQVGEEESRVVSVIVIVSVSVMFLKRYAKATTGRRPNLNMGLDVQIDNKQI